MATSLMGAYAMDMDLGFETIGNATMICHDRGPVLVTDPWIVGPAYFGSWNRSHEIPEPQMAAVIACKYAWVSHGHPDHLSLESLMRLKDSTILLPDHVGGRIAADLAAAGFKVSTLPDRTWVALSPRIRVLCIADYNQDAVLLVDVGGTLLVNLNDAGDHGWGRFVKGVIRQYHDSFLLRTYGYGDVDMINLFDEGGMRLEPPAAKKHPVGATMAVQADMFGVKHVVPFSSMHKYQRADSVWVNQYTTPLDAYASGFTSKRSELLPAFIRYDVAKRHVDLINPREVPEAVLDPKLFGDDWAEPLEVGDFEQIKAYVKRIEHLAEFLDFLSFKVGGGEQRIEFKARNFRRGLVFEVPRHSLMTTIQNECFDDLLIGNYMKTTLVGQWPKSGLYPDVAPYMAKYADNGRARSREELANYFRAYRDRAPVDYRRHQMEAALEAMVRSHVTHDSKLYRLLKHLYWLARTKWT